MNFRVIKVITAVSLFVLPAASSLAHTTVTSTMPKNGSVLEQSPPIIEISFRETARLTSVVVIEAGKASRRLTFAPSGSATVFKIENPHLAPGSNQIQWKALSMDGHAMGGSLILVIKPVAAKIK